MNSKNSNQSGGTGFIGLLTLVFITLKLTGHIDWSWWWVWSPVLIYAGITGGLFLILLGVLLYRNAMR